MPLDDDGYPRFPYVNTATAVGISVAIAGNVLISLALNLQKLAHRRLELENNGLGLHGIPEGDENPPTSSGGDASRVPSALDIAAEANPWSQSFPSLHNLATPVRTPFSDQETEPLVPTNGAHGPVSYGVATPTRERSPAARGSRRKKERGAVTQLLGWQMRSKPQHNRRNTNDHDQEEEGRGTGKSYLQSKLWWAGFLLMNLGEVGNFISYGFAPASVVAPLGTFALVANCFFAPLIQHEKFRKRDLFGVAVAIIGAVTVVLSAQTSDTRLTPAQIIAAVCQRSFIILTTIYVVGAFILISLSRRPIGQRYVLIDVSLCALFGGFTVLSTKGVSTLLTTRGVLMFKEWISYPIIAILAGTGVGQIHYLNRALMKFDSKIVIPSQFVLFNLSAIVGSGILYQDFRKTTFHQFVTFLYGCGATFAGVFIIASGSGDPEPKHREGGVDGGDEVMAPVCATEPESIRRVHVIRPRESVVSLVGLSPAQGLLLVHTPQHEDGPLPGRDVERGGRVSQRRTESTGR
ncbi:magnesium transporter NIPA-domain-containing protein [Vararia minispora EC-137]|uniref:Magnesium transporter NIPA-domain-containing protein n=1 Tax=Vararia minispora EC-137 TaxID=1314806 RepID=A0ACB8QPM3_9AGAM|nr:magnesium transporter NIPA-domain-containing protein [Vararia minispora EC-137]